MCRYGFVCGRRRLNIGCNTRFRCHNNVSAMLSVWCVLIFVLLLIFICVFKVVLYLVLY